MRISAAYRVQNPDHPCELSEKEGAGGAFFHPTKAGVDELSSFKLVQPDNDVVYSRTQKYP